MTPSTTGTTACPLPIRRTLPRQMCIRDRAYDTVKFVMAVKEIICDTYHCTFEEESLETIRLTVHLKFLAARILRHTPWQEDVYKRQVQHL